MLILSGSTPEVISFVLDLNVQTVIQVIARGDFGRGRNQWLVGLYFADNVRLEVDSATLAQSLTARLKHDYTNSVYCSSLPTVNCIVSAISNHCSNNQQSSQSLACLQKGQLPKFYRSSTGYHAPHSTDIRN
jgi:hypothetical protein